MTSIVYASLIHNGFALAVTDPVAPDDLAVKVDARRVGVQLGAPHPVAQGVRYLVRIEERIELGRAAGIEIRLCNRTTRLSLPPNGVIGALEKVQAGIGTGWVIDVAFEGRLHRDCVVAVDGKPVPFSPVKRRDIEAIAPSGSGTAFRFTLPEWARDGERHRIELRHGDRVLGTLDHQDAVQQESRIGLAEARVADGALGVVLELGSGKLLGETSVTLSLGDVALGQIALPEAAEDGPVRLPLRQRIDGLVALAGLAGPAAPALTLRARARRTAELRVDLAAPARGSVPAPLGLMRGTGRVLLDAACVGNHALRLRLAKGAGELLVLQWLPEGPRVCAAEVAAAEAEGQFATIALANPYAPLLLVLRGPGEEIRRIDLLPFPSLCRGGLHGAELRAATEGESDAAELPRLSAAILAGLLGRRAQPLDIAVVMRETTGNEPILSRDFGEWMRTTMAASVRVVRTDAEAAGAHLVLGASAVPSLSALSTVPAADAPLRPMPFALSPAGGDVGQIWIGSVPPLGPWFNALQPETVCGWYPRMRMAAAEGGRVPVPGPTGLAAIGQGLPPAASVPELLHPISAGFALPELPVPPRVVACVAIEAEDPEPALLLESIAIQTMPAPLEVVAAVAGGASAALSAKLEALFPGRHKVIALPDDARRTELLQAAAQAAGDAVLLLASGVILHDPRCLSRLAAIAAMEEVGTVGCTLVTGQAGSLSVAASGYELLSLSPAGSPAVAFCPATKGQAPRHATVPVLANPAALLCIRSRLFAALGGLATGRSAEAADVALGLAAAAAGHVNLCVGAVSAFTHAAPRPGRLEMDVLRRMPHLTFGGLADTLLVWRQAN